MNSQPRALLRVTTQQGARDFDADQVVVGREQTCDVVIGDPRASRHHLTLHRQGDAFVLIDSSTGGTFVGGQRVERLVVGPQPVSVNLGRYDGERVDLTVVAAPAPQPPAYPSAYPQPAHQPVPPVAVVPPAPTPPPVGGAVPPYQPGTSGPAPSPADSAAQHNLPPGQLAHGQTIFPAHVAPGRSLSVGRDLANDIVLDDPLVSRKHAQIDLGPTPTLTDLGSFNGTFVNGQRLTAPVALQPGFEVIFGNQTFRWDGQQLLSSATTHEFTLYADGLSVVVGGGKHLLENVSFTLEPSSLTAVIGPSGAGKSTLLGALTGLRPASHGRVIWQGHDLYQHYDQLRFQIGLVPQQDIQHPQLKVRQALGYAAELRLPPDTTPAERGHRVQTVAQQLQLTQRLDNRIGSQLSGGQKKRVSIATELLTAPPLLFLDEPTSGLDPGLDLEVMKQLRSLADDGRIVAVVTHSVLALDVCDNVMVLAPGGRVAYFGPPSGVLAHFGVRNYPEVFDLLDEPDLWQRIPMPQTSRDTQVMPSAAAAVPAPPRQSVAKQLSTLVRRNLAVVMADRLLLTMLVALPLILGALSRIVPGHDGLSLDRIRKMTPDGGVAFPAEEARQRLVVLIVAACLMGTAIAIRELVGERPIFRREYAVGLSPNVYLASKILVLGSAAFLQGLVVTFIATVGLPGADGRAGNVRIALVIGALTFTMAVVGLLLSAIVTSTEQTMPALVGVIMLQLVLSGALFPIAGRPLLAQIAWLSPSRWAYAACGSAMGITRAKKSSENLDWIAQPGAGHYLMDGALLLLLCAAAVAVGLWVTRRSAVED